MGTPDPVVVDDDGDLRLVVGVDRREFVVCSRSVARASRVFKRMLSGGFCESRQATETLAPWVVELPEDNPKAAEPLLCIAHSRFETIPATLTPLELHSLLVFAEKYDMTKLMRPWVQTWMPQPDDWQDPSADYGTMIGVAWGLGIQEAFLDITKRMVVECRVGADGQLVDNNQIPIERPEMPLIPNEYFEITTNYRLTLLNVIFTRLRDVTLQLQSAIPTSIALYCTYPRARPDACHAMTLGSIVSRLGPPELEIVFGPKEEFLSYPLSIKHLVTVIAEIEVVYIVDQHESCNPLPKLLEGYQELLKLVSVDLLTPGHIAHLKGQREKLGIPT